MTNADTKTPPQPIKELPKLREGRSFGIIKIPYPVFLLMREGGEGMGLGKECDVDVEIGDFTDGEGLELYLWGSQKQLKEIERHVVELADSGRRKAAAKTRESRERRGDEVVKVPASMTRMMVADGAGVLRSLEKEFGVEIEIGVYDDGDSVELYLSRGTPKQMEEAKRRIAELAGSLSRPRVEVEVETGILISVSSEETVSTEEESEILKLRREGDGQGVITVPNSVVSLLIADEGRMLRHLEKECNVQIDFGNYGVRGKDVYLRGTQKQMEGAERHIFDLAESLSGSLKEMKALRVDLFY